MIFWREVRIKSEKASEIKPLIVTVVGANKILPGGAHSSTDN